MFKNILPTLICLSVFVLTSESAEARIRMRKVVEAPRTCTTMKEDKFLSRPGKKIYGTLRNSVVVENDVSVVGDLGQKICKFPFEKFNRTAPIEHFAYYIDEYKNVLIPYAEKPEGFVQYKVNLANCEVEEEYTLSSPKLPKCEAPAKKKRTAKAKKKSVRV